MSLKQQLAEHFSACFTGLWIQSEEHDEALREIAQLCREQDWRLASWDVERGLKLPGQPAETPLDAGGGDPLAAIRAIGTLAVADCSAILVMVNAHRFLQSAEIVQGMVQQILTGKQNRTFLAVLSPLVQIPVELEKLFVVLEHELPSREQLEEIAHGVATKEGELAEGAELTRLLDAAAGLTRYEAENACALSLVRHRRLEPSTIWELKAGVLKKSGLLTLHRGQATDPEGLAGAMDRLLETALSTPDILDEYANPKFGEFLVVTTSPHMTPAGHEGITVPPGDRSQSYRFTIDGPLFRSQRRLLLRLAELVRHGLSYAPASGDVKLLEGLLNLTDEIADQAHDRFGVDCLLIADDP